MTWKDRCSYVKKWSRWTWTSQCLLTPSHPPRICPHVKTQTWYHVTCHGSPRTLGIPPPPLFNALCARRLTNRGLPFVARPRVCWVDVVLIDLMLGLMLTWVDAELIDLTLAWCWRWWWCDMRWGTFWLVTFKNFNNTNVPRVPCVPRLGLVQGQFFLSVPRRSPPKRPSKNGRKT